MPFETPAPEPRSTQDRKLGEEWSDWDGSRDHGDTRTSVWVFMGLAGLAVALLGAVLWLLLWLALPRLHTFGFGWLAGLAGAAGGGYLLLWFGAMALAVAGVRPMRYVVQWLGGPRWVVGLCVAFGRLLGVSRDRVGHAFVRAYNRLEVLPPLIADPAKLLLLAPRCLGRETMQGLQQLKQRYGFSQVIAFGGTEARRGIAQYRPQGIIAVACERDLLVGIKDLRGRVPVLGYANLRPEGPCKNTAVDLGQVEEGIRMFLGPGQPQNSQGGSNHVGKN
ncbi:MAG: DUF116 domain-containing protein [candidate division FCPU426 bacterium]